MKKKRIVQSMKLDNKIFTLEPIVNMLEDPTESVRLAGLNQIKGLNHCERIKKLRNLSYDSSEKIQLLIRKRLKPIEINYRKKFSYYQNLTTKYPEKTSHKFGFSLTCLRYAQTWVENEKIKEYFLQQALKNLNQLIRVHYPKTKYFYYRGQVFNDLNQTKLAIEDYKKVLQQNPKHTGALLALADLYLQTKKISNAYQLIKELQIKKLPKEIKKAVNFWFPES